MPINHPPASFFHRRRTGPSGHRRGVFGVVAAALISMIAVCPLGTGEAQRPDVLSRAEAFVASLHSFRAHVEQRYHDRVHDRDLRARATLALRRPDRLTLRYDDGRGVAIDGGAVVAVEPDVPLVHERTLPDDAFADLRGILSGTATLAETFDVRDLGHRASGDVLELRPRSRALWDRALVALDEEDTPQRVLIVDEAGNTLRWVLSRISTATLPASALSLPLPSGAETVRP